MIRRIVFITLGILILVSCVIFIFNKKMYNFFIIPMGIMLIVLGLKNYNNSLNDEKKVMKKNIKKLKMYMKGKSDSFIERNL